MLEQVPGPALYQSAGGLDAMNKALRYTRRWQEVLARGDAQMVWELLSDFVEKRVRDETVCHLKTQELFLQLLAEGQINLYIEEDWTDEEIEQDLISHLDIW